MSQLPDRLRAMRRTACHHFTPLAIDGSPQEPALCIVATAGRLDDIQRAAEAIDHAHGMVRVLAGLITRLTAVARTIDAGDSDASGLTGGLSLLIDSADTAASEAIAAVCGIGADPGDAEIIEWHDVSEASMPDADALVMMELQGEDEPTLPGSWDGEVWRFSNGDIVIGTVTGWAELPWGRDR